MCAPNWSQVPVGNGPLLGGLVLLLLFLVSVLLANTWIHIGRGHRHSCQRPSRSAAYFPSRGRARWVGGRRWRLSRRRQSPRKVSFYFPFVFLWEKLYSFSKSMVSYFCALLGMLVAKWVPTPCCNDAYSVDTRKWAFWEKGWLNHCKTTFSLFYGRFFLVSKRTFFLSFSGEFFYGCSMLGGPGILGLAPSFFTPGQLSIEFVNVGGWLTHGDLALDSCAQFLAVAEHRLIPSRALSFCHQLRRAGHHSVWSPACQDHVAGGHAWVGVDSLAGPPLLSPPLLLISLRSFSGWVVFENHSSDWEWRSGSCFFVVYGYQGVEEDADQLLITDKLLQAVLAETQVVCVGQPMLIAGDLNADPAVIPCLAKGTISPKMITGLTRYRPNVLELI